MLPINSSANAVYRLSKTFFFFLFLKPILNKHIFFASLNPSYRAPSPLTNTQTMFEKWHLIFDLADSAKCEPPIPIRKCSTAKIRQQKRNTIGVQHCLATRASIIISLSNFARRPKPCTITLALIQPSPPIYEIKSGAHKSPLLYQIMCSQKPKTKNKRGKIALVNSNN